MRTLRMWISVTMVGLLLSGCATMEAALLKPEVRGVHPRITGIDFTGVTVAFDVDVYNPNFFPIRAPRLRYAFNVEGSHLFGAETTSPISLPKNDMGMLTFPVRISYFDLIRTYQALAHAPEAHYILDGGLVFPVAGRKLELPFSYSGTFPILRPPTFSDVAVNVADSSFFRTKINVDALAKNPNVFPLGIENLGYTLKLGDIQVADLRAAARDTIGAGQTAPLSFTAEVSTANAALNLLQGIKFGEASLLPVGTIETPYGTVPLR
jgi:LEA14-like dessication related protein